MTQLCAPPLPSMKKGNGDKLFKGNMKRSPRCMQIDLLPLIVSTNIIMTRAARSPPHGPERASGEIAPAIWDEKLRRWTRQTNLTRPIVNSEVGHYLEVQTQPQSNAKEKSLAALHTVNDTGNDNDSSNEMQFFETTSTLEDKLSEYNIAHAAGKAWLSSLADTPNYQIKDVIDPPANCMREANHSKEAPQVTPQVESLCSHLDTWDAVKLQGHELELWSNHGSRPLNNWQPCPTQTMTSAEDEECTRLYDDHYFPNHLTEPQISKPCKLCPPFTSPWFRPKDHPFSEAQSNSLDVSLDWTGGEAIDTGDMDGHGFDGVGLRAESESNRVRSRQCWNGDNQGSSRRNVRQRTEDLLHQNILANEFLDNYDGFEPGNNLPRWFPQPGDVVVTKRSRQGDHLSPGGHVTLYKDAMFFFYTGEARQQRTIQHDFGDGDFVIRLGKFTEDWKWHPSPSIEAFLCDLRQVRPWWLVARTYNNELQPPEYQFDRFRAPLNTVDRTFRPREGDLVIRAVPGEYEWGLYWWNHYFNFNPCDLVLRAGYEVRANGTCMVVELYYRELDDRDWSFRGRDVWTYLDEGRPPPDLPI